MQSLRAEARELLRRLIDSDLELSEFCAEHGIDGRSLNCWRRNMERHEATMVAPQSSASQGLRLVELVPTTSPRPPTTYRVHVGDVVIQLDDQFDDDTLARLVRVVTQC